MHGYCAPLPLLCPEQRMIARIYQLTRLLSAKIFAFFASLLCACAICFADDSGPAPAGTYVVEPTHATFFWRVSHMEMSTYVGQFKSFHAKVNFGPAHLARSSVEAKIDLASVDTNFVPTTDRNFNEELKSAAFFNVAANQ